MIVSEEDQFEISGFFSINTPNDTYKKRKKGNFKNLNQHENFQKQIDKLSAASGTVHLFISGINLTKRFNWITVMGWHPYARMSLNCIPIDKYSTKTLIKDKKDDKPINIFHMINESIIKNEKNRVKSTDKK